ncbi:integrin alpha pat-2-like isoform X3 [Biomphalaria glabrata]|uniref:Integrin alpha pat-2-like isoform X3 n=1 Tax=Biomphalaria glabrata TaxID=6526 RepID=A0A9W3A016_BIOGL|nr:integrin alpha pat-2-like isoform X3 [Biomphalaria glabrata]
MEHGTAELLCGLPSIATLGSRHHTSYPSYPTPRGAGGATRCSSTKPVDGVKTWTVVSGRVGQRSRCTSSLLLLCFYSTMLVLLLLLASGAEAFNIDLRTAVVHHGPAGSFFGYSVAQHIDQSTNWLLIGAPKSNTSQPNLNQPGAVYRCRTDKPDDCHVIPFDDKGNNVKPVLTPTKRYEQIEEKSDQWFGATVRSSGENGFIVACAPRYVYFTNDLDKREPVGACYLSRPGTTKFERYSPCLSENRFGFKFQGYCQAGISAAISRDGRKLLIGAPGSWYWQGRLFNFRTDNATKPYSTTGEDSTGLSDDQYRGYSSAVGHFDDDSVEDYVVGIPKGEQYLGKVVLYNQNMTEFGSLVGEQMGSYFGSAVAVTDLNGDRLDDIIVGAPFYADYKSLTAFDNGRVYIFYQTSDKKFRPQRRDILDGPDSESRFGMAVSGLRDINYDGFEDLCVGAPYAGEDKRGAIYIYHGSKRGIITDVSQVIYAKDVSPTLSGFGISISGGIDQDGNSYPDILTGAYSSDSAVFFRTRPVVRVIASLKINPDILDLEVKECQLPDGTKITCFNLISCLTYDGYGVPDYLTLNSTVVFDVKSNTSGSQEQRVFLMQAPTKYTKQDIYRLTARNPSCITTHAYLKNDPDDKLSPIKITLTFTLMEDPDRALRPILDAYIPVATSITTQIKKDCGIDNVCVPNLSVQLYGVTPTHIIGNPGILEILVIVNNFGEDSFNTRLWIDLPPGVAYNTIISQKSSVPISCGNFNQTLVVCDLGNPFKQKSQPSDFTLVLTPTNTNDTKDELIVNFFANSSNEEKSNDYENNYAKGVIPVTAVAEIALLGKSSPEFIILNITEHKGEEDGSRIVKHVFQLINQGQCATNETELQIRWPSYDKNGNPVLPLEAPLIIEGNGKCDTIVITPSNAQKYDKSTYIEKETDRNKRNTDSQTISCSEKYCTIIQCLVGHMLPRDNFIVTVVSQFKPKSFIQRREETQMYNIKSIARARVRSVPYDFKTVDVSKFETRKIELVTTVNTDRLKPASKGVEIWIIALAVTAGLLMLLLLILLLWWCGFFKRKKPEEEGYFVVNGKSNIDDKIVD